jgi:hypothetical protein
MTRQSNNYGSDKSKTPSIALGIKCTIRGHYWPFQLGTNLYSLINYLID